MPAPNLNREVKEAVNGLMDIQKRVLPVKFGRSAINLFKDNFIKGGYQDNGLKKWKLSKRQYGSGTSAQYGTLLSSRQHLFSNFSLKTEESRVTIQNKTPYAEVHNEGYTGVQYVKPHKRNRSLASNIKTRKIVHVGGQNVRAFSRKIRIPKRQFMGDSADLRKLINDIAYNELKKFIDTYGRNIGATR